VYLLLEGYDIMLVKNEGVANMVVDNKIKAVHDDDLFDLLTSLNILDDIREKRCFCYFCDKNISLDNLSSIFPVGGEIKFCCDDDDCVLEVMGINIGGRRSNAAV